MRKSNFFVALLIFGSSHVLADPISGLNLEDFKKGTQKKIAWDANPFVKYGNNPQTNQMRLYGIIYGPDKAFALIDHEVVRVGDKIGTSEIVSITKQKVVLRNDDGIYQITMRGGAANDKT